jgi:hypothetical protein
VKNAITLLATLILLAACGVDGEPVQPAAVTGVGVTPSGVNASGGVGLGTVPLWLWLGL